MEDYQILDHEYRINGFDPVDFEVTLLEPRPFRPFKSSEEYLYAMKEDLAEWLNGLYEGLNLTADNFLELMETGVILCQHANNVVRKAREYYRNAGAHVEIPIPDRDVVYRTDVQPETFHARDNVSNFISWCRALAIKECLLFETDDLVLRKNERSFILCLLEVARRGAQFGMPAPLLVQFEQEIDAELANDDGYLTTTDRHQTPQVVTNDLRSLHERVVELLSRCTCPSQFPMIRVADGKYRIGDTKVLIFVRILRSHVMVRVGGGWDTLEHYLDKHDPCRCRSGHRLATSAKLTMQQGKSNIPSMHVTYHRPPQAPSLTPSSSPLNPRRQTPYASNGYHQTAVTTPVSIGTEPSSRYSNPHGSDDSSTSNPSLHDGRRPTKKKAQGRHKRNSAGSTSEDVTDDELYDQPTEMVMSSPASRKRELLKGTVLSSWQYTPGGLERRQCPSAILLSPRKVNGNTRTNSTAINACSRLPSLTNRNQSHSPPRIVKAPPRIQHQQPNWPQQRSQSSEDLYQDVSSNLPDAKLIFHSRGTSPVNLKGRRISTNNTCRVYPDSFRRNDPIRHSSYHSPRTYNKKSPPRPPPRPVLPQDTRRNSPVYILPERSNTGSRKQELSSPVLKKLMSSNLCSDENFLKKIEILIAEYESGHLRRDSQGEKGGPRSLPLELQEKQDYSFHPRRSPKDGDGRSPSKIPAPRWH